MRSAMVICIVVVRGLLSSVSELFSVEFRGGKKMREPLRLSVRRVATLADRLGARELCRCRMSSSGRSSSSLALASACNQVKCRAV